MHQRRPHAAARTTQPPAAGGGGVVRTVLLGVDLIAVAGCPTGAAS